MIQEMKITVCFGTTRIVVPCGTQLPVRELIRQAIVRYKKVTHKHADDYIRVQCLQTCDDEAILDEDDMVGDVLDDKDKVVASFEENLITRPGHNGGDGTSASSVGTASPDIFLGAHGCSSIDGSAGTGSVYSGSRKMVEDHKANSVVKYVDSFAPISSHTNHDVRSTKPRSYSEGRSSCSEAECSDTVYNNDNDNGNNEQLSQFKREPARKSLKTDHLDRWISMQESYQANERREPTGAPQSPDDKYDALDSVASFGRQMSLSLSEVEDTKHLNIVLKPTMGENLGITVQGYKTADGRELGLIVFDIDPKGCAARDGRVQVADRIVAVNSQDLTNISNERAEEAFEKALHCGSIELGISRSHSFIVDDVSCKTSARSSIASSKEEHTADIVAEEERNTLSPLPQFKNSRNDALPLKSKPNEVVPRIVEKKMLIELVKGNDGLGFSVTSRDNPAGGNRPIYIKNILPYGAAIRDGRLQAGDQIIKVNDVEMTGKSQEQAVTVLRSTSGQVKIDIMRKVTVTSPIASTKLIKDLERAPSDNRGNKILTYRIPLPISGTAGLGITVKGKSSVIGQNESTDDLGIFIKSIVPGGVVQADGRLCPDDQLISVNGVKLTGMSNSSAMKMLRSAMEGSQSLTSVEVTVIRSVKEFMNSVSELNTEHEPVGQSDRGIDVGQSQISKPATNGEMGIVGPVKQTTNTFPRIENVPDKGGAEPEMKSKNPEPEVNTNITQKLNNVTEDELTEFAAFAVPRKPPAHDELTELKSRRKMPSKLSAGVHRNPSYYIAMNRGGQKERHVKSKRPLKTSPFYQPEMEHRSKSEPNIDVLQQESGGQPPKKVIASYTHAARVSTPTRAFCIASRPTSTVGEATSQISTTSSSQRLQHEASAKKPNDETQSRTANTNSGSKNPPNALPIPKGTPPPPPPRTSRPSPYAKQFSNYLPVTALAARKSDSTYSDVSDVSNASTRSVRKNDIIPATEIKTTTENDIECNTIIDKPVKSGEAKTNKGERNYFSDDDVDGVIPDSFLREGFGRQSMSEKRFKLVQADITQTEFYKQRVTRSKSLEGANQVNNVTPITGDSQSQTLPHPSSTSSDTTHKEKRRKKHRGKNADSSNRDNKSKTINRVKDIQPDKSTYVRGQWQTSSDGVVKKYGRHGHYIKASPLVSSPDQSDGHLVVPSDGVAAEEVIPITMESNADFNSVNSKGKKKQSPFKVLGQALKPKAYKGRYDMQCVLNPEQQTEPSIDIPDEQRYRQLLGERNRIRSSSEVVLGSTLLNYDGARGPRRRKDEQMKRTSPASLNDFLKKGSGEYSITESAQI